MQIGDRKAFIDIKEMLTLEGAAAKAGRRLGEGDLSLLEDAVLVCAQGKVEWTGPRSQFEARPDLAALPRHSLAGGTVFPGFVECHTHTVYAGDRAQEFEWRVQGQTYQEIAARGGGILSTVRATRAASENELLRSAQERVERFVRQGVTALEIKSGYGLDLDTEMRCLRVARSLKGPEIITTYLGAHARSPDHPDLPSYMQYIVGEALPRVAREKLATRADIYIENGFFSLELARVFCERARALGFALTAHVEQLSDSGGTEFVLAYDPQSVDHVVHLSPEAVDRVARAQTTAVLLPASDFYLRMAYPPARALIDRGARVALSTDHNPGTSPTQDLSFVGVLARLEMRMTLPEVIGAFTVGAAHALGLQASHGSLSVGKNCDFTVFSGGWRELFHRVGHHPVSRVYRLGELIHSA